MVQPWPQPAVQSAILSYEWLDSEREALIDDESQHLKILAMLRNVKQRKGRAVAGLFWSGI